MDITNRSFRGNNFGQRFFLISKIIALMFVATSIISCASAIDITWEKTIGGPEYELTPSGQTTTDGGFVITGATYSYGNGLDDVFLVKTDNNGNVLWQKTFGTASYDYGRSVQQTSDGGFIIAGTATNYYGVNVSDLFLIKTDSSGNEIWRTVYGSINNDYAKYVRQTQDGGYIIVGETWASVWSAGMSDVWMVKTDSAGKVLWSRTYGGTQIDEGASVVQTADGGFIITGGTYSFGIGGLPDPWIIRTDGSGNKIWDKTIGTATSDFAHSIQKTSDGNYILTGSFSPSSSKSEVFAMKITDSGDQLFFKNFSIADKQTSIAYYIKETTDYNFIITGLVSYPFPESNNVFLAKIDGNGNKLWENVVNSNTDEIGYTVDQTSDAGYIIFGSTQKNGNYDFYLVKMIDSPPPSITDLHNTTYQQTNITWVWTDPSTSDFDKVMVYLDGVFQTNVAKGLQIYTASGLTSDSQHTIATRTVGTTSLVNLSWVNNTARTAPIPPIPPVPPGAPVAMFSGAPTIGAPPLVVSFTDTSTGSPTGWAWYFGDEKFTAPWTKVSSIPGWSARYDQSNVVLPDGSILLIGGSNGPCKNDVWRSINNGVTWTPMTASAGWSARFGHTSVVMPDGSIVLMGGVGYLGNNPKNDVWRSTDNGTTWAPMTASAGWSARYDHTSVVMPDGSIVLMGGYAAGIIKNDVWRSTDNGATWTQLTPSAGWSVRSGHTSVVMPDSSIVLMGGYDGSSKRDVWRSTDNGTTWTPMTASAGWSARSSHTSVVMPDGSIILMGGQESSNVLRNDIWRSMDNGATWSLVNLNSGWSAKFGHSSVAMPDGSIILMGGQETRCLECSPVYSQDVWRLITSGSSERNPSHTYGTLGTYTVALQVINSTGYSSTRKVSYITLVVDNIPPIITVPTSPVIPASDGSVSVQVGDAASATYKIGNEPAVPVTPVNGAITIPGFTADGSYSVVVTASDTAGNTATAPAFMVVVDKTPPTITVPTSPVTPASDGSVSVNVGDAASATYSINGGAFFTVIPVNGAITIPGFTADGSYSVVVTASDSAGNTATAPAFIVSILPINQPPVAVVDSYTMDENTFATFTVLTNDSDPNGDTLSVTGVSQGTHGAVSFTVSGVIYTPTTDYVGPDIFTYTISDGKGGTATADVSVTVNNVNQAPVLDTIGGKSVDEGVKLEFTISASDPDGGTLTFDATGVPTWATFNAGTKTFSGTPGFNNAGSSSVTFSVTDGSATDTETVTITVNDVNLPPAVPGLTGFTLGPDGKYTVPGSENQQLTFTVTSTDPDNTPVTFAMTGNLPAPATLNSDSGVFTWTPLFTDAGTYTVTITATSGGSSASIPVTIIIDNVNQAPVLDTIGGKSVDEGVKLEFTISASDPDGGTLTFDATGYRHGQHLTQEPRRSPELRDSIMPGVPVSPSQLPMVQQLTLKL